MKLMFYAAGGILVLVLGLTALVLAWVWMPGKTFRGTPPPLTEEETSLAIRLRKHVNTLAGVIGERNYLAYDNLDRARLYIEETFATEGYEVARHEFLFEEKTFYNLEIIRPGSAFPARCLVVGAHYDSVEGSPGANDNATGVAALLELARIFRSRSLPVSLKFIAFANEEPPFFNTREGMGSLEYARANRDGAASIEGMISLETIGYYLDEEGSQAYPPPVGLLYPSRGNFVAFVGNYRSRGVVRSSLRAFREHATVPSEGIAAPSVIPGISWSDHRSFWKIGVPGLMVTDTALFRDPEYHRQGDTPDRLDYDRMARLVSGLTHSITELAQR